LDDDQYARGYMNSYQQLDSMQTGIRRTFKSNEEVNLDDLSNFVDSSTVPNSTVLNHWNSAGDVFKYEPQPQ